MKALGFTEYGEPEVFEELELPKPKASEKGLVIKVLAAGVNPYDALLRSGAMQKNAPTRVPDYSRKRYCR